MPGETYIRLLQLTVLPLIASNLIVVIASLDPKEHGLASLLTVAYIIFFNFAGAAIGTTMATLIKPGVGVNMTTSTDVRDPGLTPTTSDVFADLLLCTPVGVAFMIASAILNVDDIKGAFAGLGMFVLTVTVGISVLFILCITVYAALALRNPFGFLRYILKAWFISFATTSP
ncbi:unnamed protein product [Dibothriocephalus latus]|uniref:Amino acid transporter n=1 Tax=Dibothriocephalus latus TaxID=60516 RepID=A0A3P7L3R0_DIBLA|nr:unnamed protein product [Dibothriocephalus latus]